MSSVCKAVEQPSHYVVLVPARYASGYTATSGSGQISKIRTVNTLYHLCTLPACLKQFCVEREETVEDGVVSSSPPLLVGIMDK